MAEGVRVENPAVDSGAGLDEKQRPSSSKQKSVSKPSREHRNRVIKMKVRKLEKKLELYQRKIRQMMETEVTLEEMDSDTSAYLQEDLLKRHFLKTWNELCHILRISPEIQIGSESIINCDSFTEYPAINRRLDKLIQQGEFPNFYDVFKLIEKVNDKHELGLRKSELESFAKPVFKKVGTKIKQQRQKEWRHLFGSHLTDDLFEDPAALNEELQKTLTSNYEEGERRLMAVYDHYADRQKSEGDASASSEDDEEDEEEHNNSLEASPLSSSHKPDSTTSENDSTAVENMEETGIEDNEAMGLEDGAEGETGSLEAETGSPEDEAGSTEDDIENETERLEDRHSSHVGEVHVVIDSDSNDAKISTTTVNTAYIIIDDSD